MKLPFPFLRPKEKRVWTELLDPSLDPIPPNQLTVDWHNGFGQWTIALKDHLGDSTNEVLVALSKDRPCGAWSMCGIKSSDQESESPSLPLTGFVIWTNCNLSGAQFFKTIKHNSWTRWSFQLMETESPSWEHGVWGENAEEFSEWSSGRCYLESNTADWIPRN